MSEVGQILVVDDAPSTLRLLRKLLAAQGYGVRAANNGELALRAIEFQPPELILLDIRMPGLDGVEVCRRIKENVRLREIPVLFVSALADVEDKMRAFQAGGVDYITKPFLMEEVNARVRAHLELKRQRELLAQQALTDGLTGIANYRHFQQVLANEWERCARKREPLCLLMIDVDLFKSYNDYYGHLAGDNCLNAIANCLKAALRRPADLVARYGGEEFVALLPDTDLAGGRAVADSARASIKGIPLPHAVSRVADHVTVSMGVAACQPRPGFDPGLLLDMADGLLYRAKNGGRDRIASGRFGIESPV